MNINERWFNVYENNKYGECYYNKQYTDIEYRDWGLRFNGKRYYRIHVRLK